MALISSDFDIDYSKNTIFLKPIDLTRMTKAQETVFYFYYGHKYRGQVGELYHYLQGISDNGEDRYIKKLDFEE